MHARVGKQVTGLRPVVFLGRAASDLDPVLLPPPLSAYNAPSFRAGAQLLSSLSGYAYTKRAWKKEALELFLDPAFFQMDTSCAQ